MSPLMYLPSEGHAVNKESTSHENPIGNGHDSEKNIEPIAIVGYCFRFPDDAVDDRGFWNMMMEKRCAVTEAPADRWNIAGWHHPDRRRRGQFASKGGHFLKEDVSLFDAGFFSLSADEASALDPQQRHLLEVTYGALENAGIPMKAIAGSQTSVHVGCFGSDYRVMACKDVEMTADYDVVGINACMNANRISWFFDLHGTSMNVDTACSSSLVAMDMAFQGLQSGDASMGIVAGTNLLISPDMMQVLSNVNMLSPDSRSWSFDHRANGYGRGEGTGTIIMKRLSDAIRDGDSIRAIVRSTGSNSDGLTPSGIMQPSGLSQAHLIQKTYEKAGLSMSPTRFFEAHGTGTPVGDPIECNAIGSAFRGARNSEDPLIVGSVKSNIGHLEGASGIAAVIKTIMILEKGLIPPQANLEKVNSKIDLELLFLKFPFEPTPWPVLGLRRASVNSFGFGGSNAHVILDDAFHFLLEHNLQANHHTVEYPPMLESSNSSTAGTDSTTPTPGSIPETPTLLTLQSTVKSGMKELVKNYKDHFETLDIEPSQVPGYLESLAYTLNVRRTSLNSRSFFVASNLSDLQKVDTLVSPTYQALEKPSVGFVFTGQGAQWPEMGRELWNLPNFRNTMIQCEDALRSFGCSWSLREELLRDKSQTNINEPEIAQPANTALQIALFDLLSDIGIEGVASIGHSSGEIAAAYAVGALDLYDSMKIAYFRGLYASQLAKSNGKAGGMIAVGLSAEKTQEYIDQIAQSTNHRGIIVACVNSPKSVTASGDRDQIEMLETLLHADNIFARKLKIPVAYHSSHMSQVAELYRDSMVGICKERPLRLKQHLMISSVTGQSVKAADLSAPEYWVSNLVSPVQFTKAFFGICTDPGRKVKKLDFSHTSKPGINILLEIGPHSALQGPIRDMLAALPWGNDVSYSPLSRRGENATKNLLEAIGQLSCLGLPVNMERLSRLSNPQNKHPAVLVDLPLYPFNHSTSYWRESRASKRSRFEKGRMDLLGRLVPDSHSLETRWRNNIRLAEMPWVEDHVINGTLIYPAAGMLVMAFEAASQVADPELPIAGFEVKDVKFQRALTIPRTAEGIETNFQLRTIKDNGKAIPWMHFRLFSYDQNNWEENCHGYIKVDYESVNIEEERRKTLDDCLARCIELENTCKTEVADGDVYDRLKQSGFEFGPTFQTVTGAKCNGGDATGVIKVFQWAEHHYPQAHVIHPTTLDGILHLSSAGLAGQSQSKIPTAIPTGIKSLWVAQDGINGLSSDKIHASASRQVQHKRGHEFDIYALSEQKDKVLARVKGLQSTIVAQHTDAAEAEAGPITVHRVEHVLDLDTMDLSQLVKFCGETKPSEPEPVEYFQDLNFICYKFLEDVVTAIKEAGPLSKPLLPHVQQYADWAALQVEKYNGGSLALSRPEWSEHLQSPEYFEAACERVSLSNQGGAAYVRTGRHLLNVLRGEQDPLKFLFSDSEDMMVQWYSEVNERPVCFNPWGRYLQTLARKNPTMRILEIGAGTGGSTAHILKALSTDSGLSEDAALYMSYDYTDISPAFFERAKERFGNFSRLRFQTLHIQQEPADQGFDLNSYDLIVAANVLHATPDIRKTMKNVHKLLKPDGRLMLFEITHPEIIRSGFIAGLMEGWWAGGNDGRTWSPALTVNDWDVVLKDTGFSGVDITFPEFENVECHEMDIIVASANKQSSAAGSQSKFYFLVDHLSQAQLATFNKTRDALLLKYPESKIMSGSLEECVASDLADVTVVCLVEYERPLLSNMSQTTFNDIQQLVKKCNSLLWVTCGGGAAMKVPEHGLVDGWARVLRSEKAARKICTLALDIQGEGEIKDAQVNYMICVIQQNLLRDSTADYEPEFVEIDGSLHIPRVETDHQLTNDLHIASKSQQAGIQLITDLYAAQLACSTPGLLTSLQWIDGGLSFPLESDEVYIKTSAVGVTFHDVLSMMEKIPETQLGLECSGEVLLAGERSGFQPGDRVLAFGPGKFKTDIKVKADFLCFVPTEIPLNHAAAIPMTFGLAWHILVEIGRLRKGQKVLIHAGAGALGQAAIQIANYVGAEVFATVSSAEKKQWLIKRGLPAERIFGSRDTYFASEVIRATQGRGVDVVINYLGAEVQSASWDCVGPYGHLIQVGHQTSTGSIPLSDLGRQAAFVYFDSVMWARDRPDMFREAIQKVIPLCADGHLDLESLCNVSNAKSIEGIFRSMQDETAIGKSVIDLTENVAVPTLFKTTDDDELDSDATYVISGGLGGLGQASARWMVSHGARYLVLLGRSGAATQAAKDFIDELNAEGVTVQAPPCNVVDTAAVQKVIEEVTRTMPPIRGCIQGSGLLRDNLFGEMTYEDWRLGAETKWLGSKNLADFLPQDMDFFVLLSSVSGIVGMISQSNYNAGNTYMDHLARHLNSRGRNAISLNLGPMVDDGMLLEKTGLLDQVLGYDITAPVNRSQYLTLLAHACRARSSKSNPSNAQIIYGLPSNQAGQTQNSLPDIPLLRRLKLEDSSNGQVEQGSKKEDFKSLFSKATSLKEGREVVANALLDKMVHSYQLVPEDTEIDKEAPLYTYRVDSLLAVEMCNWIAKEFVAELAVLEVMGGASFSMVELLVATRSQIDHPQWS